MSKIKRNSKPPVQRTTLFQSWNKKEQSTSWQTSSENKASDILKTNPVINIGDEDDDDDDDALLQAAEMQECIMQLEDSKHHYVAPALDEHGFDHSAGHIWIYPTNYPVREYQYNIVKSALFANTLVTLPTGLGKTFIAAVVMYNFYRWYPGGKIIFMAPTKPLVAQQIEACYKVMGIPQKNTVEMTGEMNPGDRVRNWMEKRVFFLTPQVLINDLVKQTFPAERIKCLVVDEAHKASGNYAYCQVVRELMKDDKTNFRILALSATPGSDIRAVQQVINNLCISKIELRTEESEDIKTYSFERTVEKIVVKLTEQMLAIKDRYFKILRSVTERLIRLKVLYNRQPDKLTQFLLLKAREQFRQDPPPHIPPMNMGVVEGDFALAISMYHGYDLLQLHGLRSFWKYLEGVASGESVTGRTRSMMIQNDEFCSILNEMRETFEDDTLNESIGSQKPAPVMSHPKLDKLTQVVLDHFKQFQTDNGHSNTRIMIFSQYRDSVQEITQLLSRHEPVVKAMSFIGQSVGKSSRGFSQKEQLMVMRKFREGGFNTLVSTCVGEEGLDIGDVDLIVCFDAPKSPVRLVQRMGRTGRKRSGRIVVLLTEGKEESTYNHSQYSKRSVNKAILNSAKTLTFYPNNAKLFPENVIPRGHKMFIEVNDKFVGVTEKKRGRPSAINRADGQNAHAPKSSAGAFLSAAERAEFERKYQMYERMPIRPETEILSLRDETTVTPVTDVNQPYVDFSEWLPWQTSIHASDTYGPSNRSRHLVEILNLIEMQAMADQADHASLTRLLNIDDDYQPNTDGIRKFAQTWENLPDSLHQKTDKKVARVKEKQLKTKRRKKLTSLPKHEADEDFAEPEVSRPEPEMIQKSLDVIIVEDDESDLPEIIEMEPPNMDPALCCWYGRVPPAPSVDFLDFMEDEKMDFLQIDMNSILEEWELKWKGRLRRAVIDSLQSKKAETGEIYRRKSPTISEKRRSLTKLPQNSSSSIICVQHEPCKVQSPNRNMEVDRYIDSDPLHDSVFSQLGHFTHDLMPDELTSSNCKKVEMTSPKPAHNGLTTSPERNKVNNGMIKPTTNLVNIKPVSKPFDVEKFDAKSRSSFAPSKMRQALTKTGPNSNDEKVDYHDAFNLSMSLFDESADSSSSESAKAGLPFQNYTDKNGREKERDSFVERIVEKSVEWKPEYKKLDANEADYFLRVDTMGETPSRPKSAMSMSTPVCPRPERDNDFRPSVTPIVQDLNIKSKLSKQNDNQKAELDERVEKTIDFDVEDGVNNYLNRKSDERELVKSYCEVKKEAKQITFTQALSWVNGEDHVGEHSFNESKSGEKCSETLPVSLGKDKMEKLRNFQSSSTDKLISCGSDSKLLLSSCDEEVMDRGLHKFSVFEFSVSEFENSFQCSKMDEKIGQKNGNLSKLCEEGISFDLGFNFDEESDSDVIPPTPQKPCSEITVSRCVGHRTLPESTANDVNESEYTSSNSNSNNNNNKSCNSSRWKMKERSEARTKLESPVYVKEFDECPKLDSEGFDVFNGKLSEKVGNSISVDNTNLEKFKSLDTNDSSSLSSSPSSPSLLKRKKKIKTRRKENAELVESKSMTLGMAAHLSDNYDFVENPSSGSTDDYKCDANNRIVKSLDSDSSDEEIAMKKRKHVAMIPSPDITPPVKRQKKNARRLDSSPEFKTPIKPAHAKIGESHIPKRRPKLLTEDEDDDFDTVARKLPTVGIVRPKVRKPKSKLVSEFIDHEAVLSDEEDPVSSDDTDNDLDQYEASFINDFSQQGTQPFDERVMYLQSVGARRDNPRLYQISEAARKRTDIYSQIPEPDVDDYEQDSFCVDEADESDLDFSEDEVTLNHDVTMGETTKTRRMRRRQKVQNVRQELRRRRAYQISESDDN